EQVIVGKVEIRREAADDVAVLVPFNRKRPRLVSPFDVIEVQDPGELGFRFVGEAYWTSLPGWNFGVLAKVLFQNFNGSLQLREQCRGDFNRVLGGRDLLVGGPIGILLLDDDELMTVALGNLDSHFRAGADTETAYFFRVLLKVLQSHMDFLLLTAPVNASPVSWVARLDCSRPAT